MSPERHLDLAISGPNDPSPRYEDDIRGRLSSRPLTPKHFTQDSLCAVAMDGTSDAPTRHDSQTEWPVAPFQKECDEVSADHSTSIIVDAPELARLSNAILRPQALSPTRLTGPCPQRTHRSTSSRPRLQLRPPDGVALCVAAGTRPRARPLSASAPGNHVSSSAGGDSVETFSS